jgi:hypothetical protein
MSTQPLPRKKPGPPATGQGVQIQTRVQPDLLANIDAWAAKHACTRPEALRQLAKIGLETEAKRKR